MIRPTTLAPAVRARDSSSPSGSRGSAVDLGRITPTRTARSCRTVNFVRFSSAKPPLPVLVIVRGHCHPEEACRRGILDASEPPLLHRSLVAKAPENVGGYRAKLSC